MDLFNDEYFMKEALKEARIAYEMDEVPVGAVIVCNNTIIARAHNLTERLNDATAHAEIQAITSASNYLGAKYLPECTIYVTVEPCAMCAGALYWSQIGKIVYGANDPKKGYTAFNKNIVHPKSIIIPGILSTDCATLIKDYFKQKRATD